VPSTFTIPFSPPSFNRWFRKLVVKFSTKEKMREAIKNEGTNNLTQL